MVFRRKKKSDAVLDSVIVTHNPEPTAALPPVPAEAPFALVPGAKTVHITFQEA